MDKGLLRSGFLLILIALLGGFLLPMMAIPRLGLAAHTVGIISGILLLVLGAIWQQFTLSDSKLAVMKWSWIYVGYANWLGNLIAGFMGAGRMTPLASGGAVGSQLAEAIEAFFLGSVGLVSLLAVVLSLAGLRHR